MDESALNALYEPISPFDDWLERAHVRTELVDATFKEFSEALETMREESVERILHDVAVAAALETGSIEGLYPVNTGVTLSLIEGVIAAEDAVAETTEDDETTSALVAGQLEAYQLALDAVTDLRPLTEVLIRNVHSTVCAGQSSYSVTTAIGQERQSLETGDYKRHPNHVRQVDGSIHAYAPVLEVEPEMERLIAEVTSPTFAAAHPIVRSAYLHHSITHIHPFADGNGRVARVVSSIPLIQYFRVPLVVLTDRKPQYWSSQAKADTGIFQPFVSFIEESVLDILSLAAVRLAASKTDVVNSEDLSAAIGSAIADRQKTHEERSGIAERLEAVLEAIVTEALDEVELPPGASRSVGWGSGGAGSPGGYVPLNRLLFATADVDLPNFRGPHKTFKVAFSSNPEEQRPISVTADGGQHLLLRTDEIHPRPSQALRSKLKAWVSTQLEPLPRELLGRLRD